MINTRSTYILQIMNKSKVLNSNEEYFKLYKFNLDLTKNIFNNYDTKIKIPKKFNEKFKDVNSKGILFGKSIVISFFVSWFFSLCVIIPDLAICIAGYSILNQYDISSNTIEIIMFILFFTYPLILFFVPWILAKICWKFILNDYEILAKSVFKLVDEKVIYFHIFSQYENAIVLLCKNNTHRLSYKLVFTDLTNEELLYKYYEILNSFYNQKIKISHNQIIKKLCKDPDIGSSVSLLKKSNYLKPKIRQGFSIRKFYYLSAAICMNYINEQNNTNKIANNL